MQAALRVLAVIVGELALGLAVAGTAHADDPPTAPASSEPAASQPAAAEPPASQPAPEPTAPPASPSKTSPKRPLPDYDGLPPPGTSAGDAVAWVPRVVLSPVWLVWEFVLRRPLGWLIVTAERGNWPNEILSFFTFGGRKHIGIVPTFYVDLGFRPTAGFYFFWDELLHPRHGIRLRAMVWTDGYTFSFADRWRTDEAGSRLQLRTEATRRPDLIFHGIGPRSLEDDLVRYAQDLLAAELSFDLKLGFGEHLKASVSLHDHGFGPSDCCSGGHIEDLAMPPPGYPDGYTAFSQRLEATFDTRHPWPQNGTGLRADVYVEHGATLDDLGSWMKTGATIGAFWDVSRGRTLGLTATAAIVEDIDGVIPFTELIDYGGRAAMVGFRQRRLLGESGASASLRYEWPVWAALAGSLQVEMGNVFGPELEDFSPKLFRLSTAFGLRSMGPSDHELQMLIGVGTETFDQGAELTSIRLAIGGTYGF